MNPPVATALAHTSGEVSRAPAPAESAPVESAPAESAPAPRAPGVRRDPSEHELEPYDYGRPPEPPPPLEAPRASPEPEELDLAFEEASAPLAPPASANGSAVERFRDPFDLDAPDPLSEEEDPFAEVAAPSASSGDGLPEPESFEATGSLSSSGSDILDLDTPHTASSKGLSPGGNGRGEPDLSDLADLDVLDESALDLEAPAAPRRRSERRDAPSFVASKGDLDLLHDSQQGAPSDADLDDVLRLFGPEDEQPLDDLVGLEPKAQRPARDPFDDDLSDILEPLNPSEAMEIIKSQRARDSGGGRVESEDDSLFGAPAPRRRSAARKKTRGVPFSASDEDLGVVDEPARKPARPRSSKSARKRTDPFARARRQLEEEDRAPAARNGRSKQRSSRRSARRSGRAAPVGEGDHGLVLSRISDPDKKEKAAELIAEIKGCSLEAAHRLTDRTIIPVLKGVSREVAEFHLDKFKRYKIAGRVTTRQRS
ncbi:MAG: hypothetical protein D6731_14395 [Planctomycetota bacterium]|nr:MAG: hypothetical protein D6731_14395 [Planctomycetota bacterium]